MAKDRLPGVCPFATGWNQERLPRDLTERLARSFRKPRRPFPQAWATARIGGHRHFPPGLDPGPVVRRSHGGGPCPLSAGASCPCRLGRVGGPSEPSGGRGVTLWPVGRKARGLAVQPGPT